MYKTKQNTISAQHYVCSVPLQNKITLPSDFWSKTHFNNLLLTVFRFSTHEAVSSCGHGRDKMPIDIKIVTILCNLTPSKMLQRHIHQDDTHSSWCFVYYMKVIWNGKWCLFGSSLFWWHIRIASLWIPNNMVCAIVKCPPPLHYNYSIDPVFLISKANQFSLTFV